MIDFIATLDPHNGLAAASALRPPRQPDEPLWQGLVELHPARTGAAPHQGGALAREVVGAYGGSRGDTLVRAAGEAVERFALYPAGDPATVALAAELAGAALDFTREGAELADPAAARRELRWYQGRSLVDGDRVHVPAGMVDYPAHPDDAAGFDPSPSGAASGATREQALLSALLEVIERDALITAWHCRLPLPVADPEAVLRQSPATPGRQRLQLAHRAASAAGLRPVLAWIPTGLPGVHCATAVIVDTDGPGPLAAVGACASGDPCTALGKALQEAMQIRSALRLVNRHDPADAPTAQPRTELERAQYFASEHGAAAVAAWAAGFVPEDGRPVDAGPGAAPGAAPDGLTVDGLVRALAEQGVRPVAIDLTHRLPEVLVRMGWHAVKIVPEGLQPLRLDESCAFNWHRGRLASAAARTGLTPLAPEGRREPHPLI
ncbi:YcaO-like family protein [Kitasatospora sp. NPDC048722]|uniref:YcaO-like family protein n=1 Tax=Kitasatospora sp. NPDC048722 TaxID=3155639 RepID=UPI0033D17905